MRAAMLVRLTLHIVFAWRLRHVVGGRISEVQESWGPSRRDVAGARSRGKVGSRGTLKSSKPVGRPASGRSTRVNKSSGKKPLTRFSVLTVNLWGDPQPFDGLFVLEPTFVKSKMQALHTEIKSLRPWVIAFQEYNTTAFDQNLALFFQEYSNCRATNEKQTVVVVVRSDIRCRQREIVLFDELEACKEHSRQLVQVEVMVGETWVTIGAVHLKSGQSYDTYRCKMASVARSFEVLQATRGPGVLMGDFNWFGWPVGITKPDEWARARPWAVVKQQNAEKKAFLATTSTTSTTTTTTPEGYVAPPTPAMCLSKVAHHEHFVDVAPNDDFVTFPAWDSNLYKPGDRFASRMDRLFYTRNGLKMNGPVKLINPRVRESPNGDPKFDFISDHVAQFAQFRLSTTPAPSQAQAPCNKEVTEGPDE